jgi:Tfp pilus assembly protein PilN
MIKINLLPVELRPRKKTVLPVREMSLWGGVIAAVLVFSYLAVGFRIVRENTKLAALKKEYEDLRPEYEKVMKLKADKERLEAKIAVMEKLLVQRMLWSKKLNQLSDLMPPQVWLSSVAVITNITTRTVEGKEVKAQSQSLLIPQVCQFPS